MGTLQEDLNDVGENMRELHALADTFGNPEIAASAAALHTRLADGFAAHIRPDHPELDWDQIAGNPVARGAQNRSGGKHEPPPPPPPEG